MPYPPYLMNNLSPAPLESSFPLLPVRDVSQGVTESETLETGTLVTYSPVQLWLVAGSDAHFIAAARASTSQTLQANLEAVRKRQEEGIGYDLPDRDIRLLDDLIGLRHSGPFTHSLLSVYLETHTPIWGHIIKHPQLTLSGPDETIFTSRESARYKTVRPRFYLPNRQNATRRVAGSHPMRPTYRPASDDEYAAERALTIESAQQGWTRYKQALAAGIPKERARYYLPDNHMTAGIVSGSLLAWMRAISVRVAAVGNQRETHPQAETMAVFSDVLTLAKGHFPETIDLFLAYGMVSP